MVDVKSELPDAVATEWESAVQLTGEFQITSENNNQAASDAELFAALCQIDQTNYLYLFERCKAFHINARQLRYLDSEHIRRIIPVEQIGVLAEFEQLHREWRQQFFKTEVTNNNKLVTTSEAAVQTPSVEINKVSTKNLSEPLTKKTKYALDDEESDSASDNSYSSGSIVKPYLLNHIIKNEMQYIQQEYKVHGTLTDRNRRLLADRIVNYFLNKKINFNMHLMNHIAAQIEAAFPTESKYAWHDSRVRPRRGRLFLKLCNMKRKTTAQLRRQQQWEEPVDDVEQQHRRSADSNSDMDEATQEGVELEALLSDADAQNLQILLKDYKSLEQDFERLQQLWCETTNYRTRQLQTHKNLSDTDAEQILENWPAYKLPKAQLLLNIDFQTLYPASGNIFKQRWQIFQNKIRKFYKLNINYGSTHHELYMQYLKNIKSLTESSKDCTLIQMLHVVVCPTRSIHPRQHARRYSIADSQNAFCQFIQEASEMNDYSGIQPLIFIQGSMMSVEKCYVAFKQIRYELKFLDAFYACLQLYLIFNIDFPLAALNFWTFVKSFFCDMLPTDESNMAVIDHIMKYLLN